MKKSISVILFLIPVCIFAQSDSTAAVATGGFLSKVPAWLPAALAFVYEASVRLIPTKSNWSILGLVVRIIQSVLPNRAADNNTKLP